MYLESIDILFLIDLTMSMKEHLEEVWSKVDKIM